MGDPSGDGVLKNRPVLADVSNQLGKRRFVSISSGGSEKNEAGKSFFGRKDYPGAENLGKGKCVFEFGGKGDSSVLKAKQLGGSWNLENVINPLQQNSVFGREPVQLKANHIDASWNLGNRVSDNLPFTNGNVVKKSVTESGDGLNDNSIPSGLIPEAPDDDDKAPSALSLEDGEESDEGTDSDVISKPNGGIEVTNVCGSNGEGIDAGELTSNKSSSTAGSIPSSGSKACESEKCAFLNHEGSSNATTSVDFLKTCSCSFCLKAAYIWTDLQYQDTKGRIAALKRSRKDVRSVIERSCTYGGFGKNVQVNSNKPTKLEHDLMGQWRSLFLHTEDVLIRENTQLQSSLLTLKELRENCKSDLGMTNGASSNN